MAFDATAFNQRFFGSTNDEFKKAYGVRKGGRFPFMRPKTMVDGAFKMRFCPAHPQHCEDGWLRVATHRTKTGLESDYESFTCLQGPEDGEDCAWCEALTKLIPLLKSGNLSSDIDEAIRETSPYVRGVFPVFVYAEEVKKTDAKGNEITLFKPSDKLSGAIFEVSAEGLLKEIGKLMVSDERIASKKHGRWFSFVKRGFKYGIDLPYRDREPLSEEAEALLESYPQLEKIYFKNVQKLDWDGQVRLLGRCWWAKDPKVARYLEDIEDEGPPKRSMRDDDDDDLPEDDDE